MKRSVAIVIVLLTGCATAEPGPVEVAGVASAAAEPAPRYELTKEEKALDCRRLTGRMKVRISVMRSQADRPKASAAASTAQLVAKPILGGTSASADLDADYRSDRAKLEAYNRRLVELKCPTVDIDAELKGGKPAAPAPKPAAAKSTAG